MKIIGLPGQVDTCIGGPTKYPSIPVEFADVCWEFTHYFGSFRWYDDYHKMTTITGMSLGLVKWFTNSSLIITTL